MSRRMIIAGNWKMNKTPAETTAFIETLKPLVAGADADVVCCVPAIDLVPAVQAAKGSNIFIGAENMHYEESGAYTGEIAPNMLVSAGVSHVILGHSERREYFAETDETVNRKVKKSLEHGLIPIVCCGETLTQREQGITIDWIRQQVKIAFLGVSAEQAAGCVIAYEPIWSIGPGKTPADKPYITKIARFVKQRTGGLDVVYGGGLKQDNAAMLALIDEIDGGLIALTRFSGEIGFYPDEYLDIIRRYLGK